MGDFTLVRSDRRNRLVTEPDKIVGWKVRWSVCDHTYERDFDYEIDATDFYSNFEAVGIEVDLEPIWGWEIDNRVTSAKARDYEYVVEWVLPTGETVTSTATYLDEEMAEDVAVQMRLAGLSASIRRIRKA